MEAAAARRAGRPAAERAARAGLLTLNPNRDPNQADLPAEHAVDLLHVPLLVEEVEEDALLLLVVHRTPGPQRGSTSAACTGEALRRRKGGRYLSAKRGRGGRAKADKARPSYPQSPFLAHRRIEC